MSPRHVLFIPKLKKKTTSKYTILTYTNCRQTSPPSPERQRERENTHTHTHPSIHKHTQRFTGGRLETVETVEALGVTDRDKVSLELIINVHVWTSCHTICQSFLPSVSSSCSLNHVISPHSPPCFFFMSFFPLCVSLFNSIFKC